MGREASTLLVSVNLAELGELRGPSGSVALWRDLAAPLKPQERWPLEAVKAKTLILEDLWFKT